MKKSLLLLTSLLATGSAIAPLLTHEVSTQKNVKSTDVVDLTMPWWGNVKVELPNLTKLLNDNLTPGQYLLKSSSFSLINKAGKDLTWDNTGFDNSNLRSRLGKATGVNRVELSASESSRYQNLLMAYWTMPDSEQESALVLGRFYTTGLDMSSYWTTGTKVQFNLTF